MRMRIKHLSRPESAPPRLDLAVAHTASQLHAENGLCVRLSARSEHDLGVPYRQGTSIHHRARPGQQDQGSASHVHVNTQRVARNHRIGEVEHHVAPRGPQLQRRGTTQRPQRRTEPPRLSTRITSPACTAAAPDRPGSPVRSAVRMASSSIVREDKAASRRSSNSSAVSRPSPAASRSTSTARSRSASEALTLGDAPGPSGSPTDGKTADTPLPVPLAIPHYALVCTRRTTLHRLMVSGSGRGNVSGPRTDPSVLYEDYSPRPAAWSRDQQSGLPVFTIGDGHG
jgi:hypothetical protein